MKLIDVFKNTKWIKDTNNIRYEIARLWLIGYSTLDIAKMLNMDANDVYNLACKIGLIKQ